MERHSSSSKKSYHIGENLDDNDKDDECILQCGIQCNDKVSSILDIDKIYEMFIML